MIKRNPNLQVFKVVYSIQLKIIDIIITQLLVQIINYMI